MNKIFVVAAAIAASPLYVFAQDKTANTMAEANDTTYSELEELVITAKRDIVRSDGGTITYDVEQDDASKGKTVLDALRNIPMVTVDGQDNIRIKGDSDFKIYVNGKEDPMLTANASRVLKMMPADAVSKIEVITEPGAKYDAEGTGGILNIITTRRESKDGYTGSVNASAMSLGYMTAGIYGRLKKDRVTADAEFNWFGTPLGALTNRQSSDRIALDEHLQHLQRVRGTQKARGNFYDASLNLSWEPTGRDLFSFGATFRNGLAKIKEYDPRTSMYDGEDHLLYEYEQRYRGNMEQLSTGANFSYQHSFDDQGHRILAAYRFDFGRSGFPMTIETVDVKDYPVTPGTEWLKKDQSEHQREHTAQIDYANPFGGERHLLETGVKGIFRRNNSRGETYTGQTEDALHRIEGECTDAAQFQDILAIYASYTGNFNPISFTAGVRYEHTRLGMRFILGSDQNFTTRQNDVVPNASVTWMFGPASNLRLAYQTRIRRPDLWQTSPFRQQSVPTVVKVGNPGLESERFNSISLTYSNFGPVLGGNVGMTYNRSDNTIEKYSYYEGNTRIETYGNFGTNSRVELSGFLNWNITPKMTLMVNGLVSYTDIRSNNGSGLRNHGWSGNYGATWNYTDPIKIKYTVYGGESFHNINLQGYDGGYYYYGVSISRDFLKNDQLNVTLSANNFLREWQKFSSETRADGYLSRNVFSNRCMNFGISLTWKFGHLQEKVRKGDLQIENDDLSTRSNRQGTGGISL